MKAIVAATKRRLDLVGGEEVYGTVMEIRLPGELLRRFKI